MKKAIIVSLAIGSILISGFLVSLSLRTKGWKILSPVGRVGEEEEKKEKPLEKYEFERLRSHFAGASRDKGEIVLEKLLSKSPAFTSYIFSYTSEGKKISGMANVPNQARKDPPAGGESGSELPVIVMLRGYVDLKIYQTGVGTQRAGEIYASNGYLTLAPDYVGYGESDMPPDNIWEERFMKVMTIMDLIASIPSMQLRMNGPSTLRQDSGLRADSNRVGIWGHSNGGLTALSVLEISGKDYPTTLWAPVSQFFPYDILYYTFEAGDKGKALRKSLAELEAEYDIDKYSFDEYLEWIKAPIQLHQGLADPYIPVAWSDSLARKLEVLGNEVEYYKYPGAGHNMEGSWDLVVQRDLEFFQSRLDPPAGGQPGLE